MLHESRISWSKSKSNRGEDWGHMEAQKSAKGAAIGRMVCHEIWISMRIEIESSRLNKMI